MTLFTEVQPTLENYWRSIILFGRNVASYKFALGKSLLDLAQQGTEIVTLDQLAEPFSLNICEHLQLADKQATSKSRRFLETCRKFNAGETKKEELLEATAKLGFNNVIDAFHVVHDGDIAIRFFTDERNGSEKGIRLTEDLFRLTEQFQYRNLPTEVEARWRLVETAWELKLPRHVLTPQVVPVIELSGVPRSARTGQQAADFHFIANLGVQQMSGHAQPHRSRNRMIAVVVEKRSTFENTIRLVELRHGRPKGIGFLGSDLWLRRQYSNQPDWLGLFCGE